MKLMLAKNVQPNLQRIMSVWTSYHPYSTVINILFEPITAEGKGNSLSLNADDKMESGFFIK
jgi:hypothetical protein